MAIKVCTQCGQVEETFASDEGGRYTCRACVDLHLKRLYEEIKET